MNEKSNNLSEKMVDKNTKLNEMYLSWSKELYTSFPELMVKEYSNPYYTAIPKGWFDSDKRILVVGEEGFGTGGCGKSDGLTAYDITTIQTFNWEYLASNIYDDVENYLYPNAEKCGKNPSAFWRRFRKVSQYGVCAWSNIDKIHYLGNRGCSLNEEDRIKLHSTHIKVLKKEIEILEPTHVVFFGWYGISLQSELPSIFSKLYPKGLGDNSLWNKNVVVIKDDSISYIFAYHPSWGFRQKGYEDLFIKKFESTL